MGTNTEGSSTIPVSGTLLAKNWFPENESEGGRVKRNGITKQDPILVASRRLNGFYSELSH